MSGLPSRKKVNIPVIVVYFETCQILTKNLKLVVIIIFLFCVFPHPSARLRRIRLSNSAPKISAIFQNFLECVYSNCSLIILPYGKKINLEEKNVELKIANWIFKIGEIAELKIANGQSLA